MLRAIVERHEGRLPVDTVEGIWRIIISTFTYVQSPYSVHIDVSRGESAMRDSERFHFGFTVPVTPHFGAAGVIEAVARSGGDLGMFALDGGAAAGRLVDAADRARRAEGDRAAAVRRAARPSGGAAGLS